MRTFVRTISAVTLAALVALVPAAAASAAKPKAAAWAKKYHLTGAWRAKDADRDGVKNYAEFKLGTNPRKADTDKDGLKDGDEVKSDNDPRDPDTDDDGIKDGAEHAGVVTAFDGDTIRIRQFNGPAITAALDDSCDVTASSAGYADTTEDDPEDDFADDPEAEASSDDSEADLDDSCDFADLEKGAVLTQAEFETRGGALYLLAAAVV